MLANNIAIRPITEADNPVLAQIIRAVSAEYGLTPDRGFSVADPTLDALYQVYQAPKSKYWLVEQDGMVQGGVGIAPLPGYPDVCELQKMYFLPQLRGQGVAWHMSQLCFTEARQYGFKQIYLETTACLKEALALYQALGFATLERHLGDTGHDACEIPMLKQL
nr:GNAT family N-acetyltransferase [Shewanella gelidii]